jgi:hypothetical protein
MEPQNFISWIVYSAIVLIIAGPVLVRLVRNVALGLKLRRRRKATHGPLLGVVYPQKTKGRNK